MKRRDLLLTGPALFASGLSSSFAAPATVFKFGQSGSLTGGQAAYGKEVRDGIAAAFASANAADASKGLRYELVTLDDGGDRERCKANAKTLIDSGVIGLIGFTSGAAAEAALALTEETQVALLGTASGNMGLRSSKYTTPFHVRAGYDIEFKRMVSYVKDFGMRRVGYAYMKDAPTATLSAMTSALETVGVKITEMQALDRNAATFQAEAQKFLEAKLDCILFTTNAAPIASIVDHMAAGKYGGMYFSSSFAGQSLIDAMAQRHQSVVMTQVVPRPTAVALPIVSRCKQDLLALGNDARMGFTALEGYIAGSVAVEAIRASARGTALTRARFKESLASLRADLGGYKVDFTKGSAQGSQFVDVVAIDRQGRIIG